MMLKLTTSHRKQWKNEKVRACVVCVCEREDDVWGDKKSCYLFTRRGFLSQQTNKHQHGSNRLVGTTFVFDNGFSTIFSHD